VLNSNRKKLDLRAAIARLRHRPYVVIVWTTGPETACSWVTLRMSSFPETSLPSATAFPLARAVAGVRRATATTIANARPIHAAGCVRALRDDMMVHHLSRASRRVPRQWP
jgi:hypothetical protein